WRRCPKLAAQGPLLAACRLQRRFLLLLSLCPPLARFAQLRRSRGFKVCPRESGGREPSLDSRLRGNDVSGTTLNHFFKASMRPTVATTLICLFPGISP